jgi:hypothetical protein
LEEGPNPKFDPIEDPENDRKRRIKEPTERE